MPLSFLFKRKSEPTKAPAYVPSSDVEGRIQQLGREMLEKSRAHEKGLLSAKFYKDKLMDWAMSDENFKTQLFRFVDCFPMLKTPEAVHAHIVDYLMRDDVKRPAGFDLAMKAGAMMKGMVASTMSSQITGMASQFIAGSKAEEAIDKLRKMWSQGMCASVDLLGEACVSDDEADVYLQRYLAVMQGVANEARTWAANPKIESDSQGPVPRVNVSIKLSTLSARLNPMDIEASIADLRKRMVPVLQQAKELGAFINFDMESSAYKAMTIEAFKRFAHEFDVPMGIAMQAYLRSGDDDARDLADWAKKNKRVVTVRLVKGAYWDFETVYAEMMHWEPAVWAVKPQTDACFERMTNIFLDAAPRNAGEGGIRLALGSHNLRSIAAALTGAEKRGLPQNVVELQMLYGMGDPMKAAAIEMGLRVRNYMPLGEMIPGMAYLVRRLLENTSNESWLLAGFAKDASVEKLFASPHGIEPKTTPRPPSDFMGESYRDFSFADQRDAFANEVSVCHVPKIENNATIEQAKAAMDTAQKAFATWREVDVAKRAEMLRKASAIMRKRRDELSAVMTKEAGKTWVEADADTCEAIDFCEYYAEEAERLFAGKKLGRYVGEQNFMGYEPRGVAVVISPWNFPLAICCGMTVAALVCGNPVIVKPAEQTPGIARLMTDILHEAGIPRDVLQFIAGQGETVGAYLVRDPRTALIAFTGSKAVGLDIVEAAGKTPDTQWHVKKVISEMGGKNALIIDGSADLDEAVIAARQSAFGFQGQKCSACSRVIVVDPSADGAHYKHFVDRFVAATKTLTIGDPTLSGTQIGPVIDADSKAKIESYIAIGKSEAKCALAMPVPAGLEQLTGRCYVGPHIFVDVDPKSRIATEEIFGPVVAVMKVATYEEAVNLAMSLPYRLTGGVFTRTPKNLDYAKKFFRVGNLYLNRGITGALVGRQPFGGGGMSGVGSKAGGPDYLQQFVEPRVWTENTLRRGFAPAVQDE